MRSDLPAPDLLWSRWALFASTLTAIGVDDVYWCAADGAHHDDHGGNWSRLVRVEGGRAVLFGYDHEYSDTVHATPPIDLLAGAPAWLPWPELLRWQADDQLGYVYWYDRVWSRVPYPEKTRNDGMTATAGAVLDAGQTRLGLAEVVFEWAEHERDDPAERADVASAADRLLAAAETRGLDAEVLSGLLGRLPAGSVDLAAALTVATAAGLTPGGTPPTVPAGTVVPARRMRVLSDTGHEELVRTARRGEVERHRTGPAPSAELAALVDWLRAESPTGDGRCTLVVTATDDSVRTQPGPQSPRALSGKADWTAFDRLVELVRRLRAAEAHPTEGRWFFLRVTTTPDGHTVDRRYDSGPDWLPTGHDVLPLDALRQELARRAPEYRPSWAPLLAPEVAWRDVPGSDAARHQQPG